MSAKDGQFAEIVRFPVGGDLLAAVQLEWDAVEALSAPAPPDLPRPWIPATCTSPGLLHELRAWFGDVVDWLNAQHTWNPDSAIPPCWSRHPHLVHDIAVLADQRRRAEDTTSSTALEHWHRVVLPAFLDRTRASIGQWCAADHQPY
ncbi:hypothetical protein [Microlunatus flavus]|uniref:Uncharacterized protein n=1 Tax=Microlunatus flavus TaxID=1036181 RepID=A0A1H9MVU0_9ACTN|nr:hypothetical protein [Microlunatus flavus]SER27802.1 hypothetical protein SAMN05421756_111102 [Microlunatus flavus]